MLVSSDALPALFLCSNPLSVYCLSEYLPIGFYSQLFRSHLMIGVDLITNRLTQYQPKFLKVFVSIASDSHVTVKVYEGISDHMWHIGTVTLDNRVYVSLFNLWCRNKPCIEDSLVWSLGIIIRNVFQNWNKVFYWCYKGCKRKLIEFPLWNHWRIFLFLRNILSLLHWVF